MNIGDVFKNISGGAVGPLNSVQTAATSIQNTVATQGQQLTDSAQTAVAVGEAYAGIQLLISLAGLGIAFGMLEMYKKTYALQRSRMRKGKK